MENQTGNEKKRVMLLDDEPDITYIVEFILTSADFMVDRVNDAEKAIPEMLSRDYDLLILDLMMPKLSGFEVLEALRKESKLERLPVLILSSRQLTRDETAALAASGAEMVAKPFEPQRLLDKVREMVMD